MVGAVSANTYWRIASYPTWTGSLQQYHYDTFNMFFHFNMEPQNDGSLGYGGIETAQNARDEIAKAHAQNDLMVLVIGGWGYGSQFQGATSDANRAKFVSEITNRVSTLGYDGITVDWEDGVNNANLVKTMKELRAEFNKLNPVPLLLIDVCCEVTTDSIKQIEPYVDSINTMDYESGARAYFNGLRAAGIPASKIINGLGFYAYVNSEARARSEAQFVIDNGMKGIEVWDTGEVTGADDPRTKAIRELLGTGPAIIPQNPAASTPVYSPAAGTYKTAQTVIISTRTIGAVIHYTLDGTDPIETSPKYTEPISVSSSKTIKSGAWKSGMAASNISSATYTISSVGGAPGAASLILKTGWNQVSSPIAEGVSLATIEQSCTILQYKNQKLWAWDSETQMWTNPIKIEPLKGYWIYAAYQCTVPVSGTQAAFSSLQLHNGWNKISASGAFSAISRICAGHITGNWIWNWDKATESWVHPAEMQLDKGYWIHVDQDCVLGA